MSFSRDPDRDGLRLGLVVLKTFSKNAQSKHFCFRHGLVRGGSIGENPGKLRHFREPAPVFFAFVLNRKIHVSPRRLGAFYARSFLATNLHLSPTFLRPPLPAS